jgi:hypothetical protein
LRFSLDYPNYFNGYDDSCRIRGEEPFSTKSQ